MFVNKRQRPTTQSYSEYENGDSNSNHNNNNNRSYNKYNNSNSNYSDNRNQYDNKKVKQSYQETDKYNRKSYKNYDNYNGSNNNSAESSDQQQGGSQQQRYAHHDKSHKDKGGVKFSWTHDGRNDSELSAEMRNYFKRTQKAMERDEFPDDHERTLFIESVLRETANALIQLEEPDDEDEEDETKPKKKKKPVDAEKLAKKTEEAVSEFLNALNYPSSSRIIQSLCEVAAPAHLRSFFRHFMKRIKLIATGKFSSFILNTILKRAPAIIEEEIQEKLTSDKNEDEEQEDEEDQRKEPLMLDMLKKIREELKNSLSDMTIHPLATFFVRDYVKVLALLNHEGLSNRYKRLLVSVIDEILRGTEFKEWIPYQTGIASLVSLLETIPNDHPSHDSIIKFIFGVDSAKKLNFADDNIKRSIFWLMRNNATTHLLQAIIKHCSESVRNDLYAFVFRNKLQELSLDKFHSYIVEDLISNATHTEQFELMMKELEPELSKIWQAQTRHVINAIAEGCIKFNTKQKEFIKELMAAFNANQYHSSERQKLVNILLYNSATPQPNPRLDRFGCQLLATMFKFDAQQLQVLLESFLAMDNQLFTEMCCDKFGSQVAEALVMSKQAVGSRAKYKIIKKLKGSYARLAKDMFGSHVIEKCMFVCEAKRKKDIAAELVADEKNMRNCKHGIIIWNKCFLSKFKQDAEQWLSVEDKNEKRREMFREILEDKTKPTGGEADKTKSSKDSTEQQSKKNVQNKNKKPVAVDPLLASTKNKKGSFKLLNVDVFANVKATGAAATTNNTNESDNEINNKKRKREVDEQADSQDNTGGIADIGFISQAIKKLKK